MLVHARANRPSIRSGGCTGPCMRGACPPVIRGKAKAVRLRYGCGLNLTGYGVSTAKCRSAFFVMPPASISGAMLVLLVSTEYRMQV